MWILLCLIDGVMCTLDVPNFFFFFSIFSIFRDGCVLDLFSNLQVPPIAIRWVLLIVVVLCMTIDKSMTMKQCNKLLAISLLCWHLETEESGSKLFCFHIFCLMLDIYVGCLSKLHLVWCIQNWCLSIHSAPLMHRIEEGNMLFCSMLLHQINYGDSIDNSLRLTGRRPCILSD